MSLRRYGFAFRGWGRSGCVAEPEDAEPPVEVEFGLGGLPRHTNRLGVSRAGGLTDVTQGAEEGRRYTDPSVDVVGGEALSQRGECVG
jgi:hypothetical protein